MKIPDDIINELGLIKDEYLINGEIDIDKLENWFHEWEVESCKCGYCSHHDHPNIYTPIMYKYIINKTT